MHQLKESGDCVDRRHALPTGAQLAFPGMQCTIGKEIGRGSNAIVYEATYLDHTSAQLHHVLVKELFPFTPDGTIRRDETLSLCVDDAARDAFEVHRLSFEMGNEAHLKLLASDPQRIGANLNTFPLNGTWYTVLGVSGGRSMEALLHAEPQASLKAHVKRMLGLLDALRAFHDAGCVHLDISPDNALVLGEEDNERLMLIDFNSVHDVATLQSGSALYYSHKPGYTPPEVRAGRVHEIGMASDLFSVTAVFYRMIAGVPLTDMQLLKKAPPEVDMHPCMQGMSEPVQSMVRHILKKGLSTIVRRRYQHIAEMCVDLRELLDRIEGVGITHWALWENGKRTVSRLIRSNASMHYLQHRESMYPLRCQDASGDTVPAGDMVARILSGGPSLLLTAPGGMGKTTALLDAVEQHTSKFSPAAAAVVYVPLYAYRYERDGGQYIMNSILEGLRFRADTATYQDARQVLSQLMDQPLMVRGSEKPAVLLLLDGLNEAQGDLTPLLHEILTLNAKAGVRIIVTSRSSVPELPFDQASLSPLAKEDVRQALAAHGLLIPESRDIQQLLTTPMMLSMFIGAAEAEQKQLQLQSADELLATYLQALMNKEQREMDEQSPERWQLEAAMQLVLPALAHALARHPEAADDQPLLQAAERCHRLLPTRRLKKLHPRWNGHHKEIRGDAKDAEEWYGLMVHELLWQRLGLLVRDAQGRYRINHQIMAEYLLRVYHAGIGAMEKRHKSRQIALGALTAVMLTALLAAGGRYLQATFAPPQVTPVPRQPYHETQALKLFDFAIAQYVRASSLTQSLGELNSAVQSSDPLAQAVQQQSWASAISLAQASAGDATQQMIITALMQKLPESGEVMPWSQEPFDFDQFTAMQEDYSARVAAYQRYGGALVYALENPALCSKYLPEYPQLLQALLEADARILASMYRLVCLPHLTGLEDAKKLEYDESLKTVAMVASDDLYAAAASREAEEGQLQILLEHRKQAENRLNACALVILYDRSLK